MGYTGLADGNALLWRRDTSATAMGIANKRNKPGKRPGRPLIGKRAVRPARSERLKRASAGAPFGGPWRCAPRFSRAVLARRTEGVESNPLPQPASKKKPALRRALGAVGDYACSASFKVTACLP